MKRNYVWVVAVLFTLSFINNAFAQEGKNKNDKTEKATVLIPLSEPLKEDQVKKLAESFKSFDCGEVSGIKTDSKQITVTTKSALHLTELEKIFKKADVQINKEELVLKGRINLKIKVIFKGG